MEGRDSGEVDGRIRRQEGKRAGMQSFCSRLAQKKRKGKKKNDDKEKRREDFLIEKGNKRERSCLSAGRGERRDK
jgi:hypothetical protein